MVSGVQCCYLTSLCAASMSHLCWCTVSCSYASRLKLITEDFRSAISELNSKGKTVVPDHVTSHIFLNIRQIYTLSQQILSDLQKRMDNWEEIEEIGDVLSTLAPFLKVSCLHTHNTHNTHTQCVYNVNHWLPGIS